MTPGDFINVGDKTAKMKEISDRTRLILWDAALLIGIVLIFALHIPDTYRIIIGLSTSLILSNALRNHIAVYKLNGKIY